MDRGCNHQSCSRTHDVLTATEDAHSVLNTDSDYDHLQETDSQRSDQNYRQRRTSSRQLSCSIQDPSSFHTFLLDEDEIPTRDAGLDLSFSNNSRQSLCSRVPGRPSGTNRPTVDDRSGNEAEQGNNLGQPRCCKKKKAKSKRGGEAGQSRNNNSLNFREKLQRLEDEQVDEEELKQYECGDYLPIAQRPSGWQVDDPYELIVTTHNVDTLLISARFYNQRDVIGLCRSLLLTFDVQTVLYYKFVAEKHELVDIIPFLIDFMRANFLAIVNSHSFLGMSLQQLKSVLSDDGLKVRNELDVFWAARAWVDHSKKNRIKEVGAVMACVRFHHISPEDIVRHVEPNKSYFRGPGGREVLLSIYRYHALSSSRGDKRAASMNLLPPRAYVPLGVAPFVSAPLSAAPSIPLATTTSIAPFAAPSSLLSAAPSIPLAATPSTTLSAAPSIAPFATPSSPLCAAPSIPLSAAPSITPFAAPSIPLSAAPFVAPFAAPSILLSAASSIPLSAAPSVVPTAAPSIPLSAAPFVAPFAAPSIPLSAAPSIPLSAVPSVAPTAAPSITPFTAPSSPLCTVPSTQSQRIHTDQSSPVSPDQSMSSATTAALWKDTFCGGTGAQPSQLYVKQSATAQQQQIELSAEGATDGVLPSLSTNIGLRQSVSKVDPQTARSYSMLSYQVPTKQTDLPTASSQKSGVNADTQKQSTSSIQLIGTLGSGVSRQIMPSPSMQNQQVSQKQSKQSMKQNEDPTVSFTKNEQPSNVVGLISHPVSSQNVTPQRQVSHNSQVFIPSDRLPEGSGYISALSVFPCQSQRQLTADQSAVGLYVTPASNESILTKQWALPVQQDMPSSHNLLTVPSATSPRVGQGTLSALRIGSDHKLTQDPSVHDIPVEGSPSNGFRLLSGRDYHISNTCFQQNEDSAGDIADATSFYAGPARQDLAPNQQLLGDTASAANLASYGTSMQRMPVQKTISVARSRSKINGMGSCGKNSNLIICASDKRNASTRDFKNEQPEENVKMSWENLPVHSAAVSRSQTGQVAAVPTTIIQNIPQDDQHQKTSNISVLDRDTEKKIGQRNLDSGDPFAATLVQEAIVPNQAPRRTIKQNEQSDVPSQAARVQPSQQNILTMNYGNQEYAQTQQSAPMTEFDAKKTLEKQTLSSKSLVAERRRSFEALQAQQNANHLVKPDNSSCKLQNDYCHENIREQAKSIKGSELGTTYYSGFIDPASEDVQGRPSPPDYHQQFAQSRTCSIKEHGICKGSMTADMFSEKQLDALEEQIKLRRKEIAKKKMKESSWKQCTCKESPHFDTAVQAITSVKIHYRGSSSPQQSPYASPNTLNVAEGVYMALPDFNTDDDDCSNINDCHSDQRGRTGKQGMNAARNNFVVFKPEEENIIHTYPSTPPVEYSSIPHIKSCHQKEVQHRQEQDERHNHAPQGKNQRYAGCQKHGGRDLQQRESSQLSREQSVQCRGQSANKVYPVIPTTVHHRFHQQKEENCNNPDYRSSCPIRPTNYNGQQCHRLATTVADLHMPTQPRGQPPQSAMYRGNQHKDRHVGSTQQISKQAKSPRRHRSQSPAKDGPQVNRHTRQHHQSQSAAVRSGQHFNDNAASADHMMGHYGEYSAEISEDGIADNSPQDNNTGLIYRHHPYTNHGDNQIHLDPDQALIVAVGGLNPTALDAEVPCRLIELYDVADNKWSFLGKLPEARHHHGCVMLDGYLYVIGGSMVLEDDLLNMSLATNTSYRYDFGGDFWTMIAPMTCARMYHAVAVLEGVIYAVGGETSSDTETCFLDSCEFYNPDTDEWGPIASMIDEVVGAAVIGFRGLLWVIGGFLVKDEDNIVLASVECYNPRTNSWTTKQGLPVAVCHASVVEVEDSLFLVGGANVMSMGDPVVSQDHILQYLEQDDLWLKYDYLSVPRHDASCCVIGSRLFVLGGVCSALMRVLDSVECYDIATGEYITDMQALPSPALGLSCVVIQPEHFDQ